MVLLEGIVWDARELLRFDFAMMFKRLVTLAVGSLLLVVVGPKYRLCMSVGVSCRMLRFGKTNFGDCRVLEPREVL